MGSGCLVKSVRGRRRTHRQRFAGRSSCARLAAMLALVLARRAPALSGDAQPSCGGVLASERLA